MAVAKQGRAYPSMRVRTLVAKERRAITVVKMNKLAVGFMERYITITK